VHDPIDTSSMRGVASTSSSPWVCPRGSLEGFEKARFDHRIGRSGSTSTVGFEM
jgi:hypothetical protein